MSRIDVVCPTYNRSALLREAVLGVLGQTVADWRLVIVSDGSTDDTAEVVARLGDRRIRFVEGPRTGHPGGPRNTGLAEVTAPFVAYLDDDDRWRPDHLATLLRHFDSGARWVGTGNVHVGPDGRELGGGDSLLNTLWHPDLQLLLPMFEPSRVAHARGVAEAAGGWATERVGMEDWDLWMRVAANGEDLVVAPESTVLTRFDPASRQRTTRMTTSELVLGVVGTARAAEAVLARARSPKGTAVLRRMYYEDMLRWLVAMFRSGRMSVPPGTEEDGLVASWAEMDSRMPEDAQPPVTSGLAHRPEGDGHVVFLPIQCVDEPHAAKVRELLERVDGRRLAWLRDLIARS